MATYSVKITTEKDLPVEVTFPSWYKYGENEFIWLKSMLEVVKVEVMQYHLRRQYDISYVDFVSIDDVKHFVVSGRKSSQAEFMTAYNMAQDVLRDAFVSYKHLDKTLEALELEYTQGENETMCYHPEMGMFKESEEPQKLTEYLATVLQKDENL